MNQVKTYIDKSNIDGIGLFAGEFILKGTLIWKFSGIDQKFTKKEITEMNLNAIEEDYLYRYAFGKNEDEIYWCSDYAKYCNHSPKPNTFGYPEQWALVDIHLGEEITCDYTEILSDEQLIMEEKEFDLNKGK